MEDFFSDRYARQLILSELGPEGQRRIMEGKVLVIGAGGLGCPALLYLAGAGVGTIGIVDHDRVEASNLPRQVLYGEQDLGVNKAEAAMARLMERNSMIRIEAYPEALQAENVEALIGQYDLVLDCTDDIGARRIINATCRRLSKPMVFGALHRFQGQVSVFHYHQQGQAGADYANLVPEGADSSAIPSCSTEGVLGVVPGVIGTLQAEQALRILCGYGEVLSGKVFLFDIKSYRSYLWDLSLAAGNHIPGSNPNAEVRPEELPEGSYVLLDVREEAEQDGQPLAGAVHLPFSNLDQRVHTLDKLTNWLVVCKHGNRSRATVSWLRSKGFIKVHSLKGGIAGMNSFTSMNQSIA